MLSSDPPTFAPTLAPESFRCRTVIPSVRNTSSRDTGWSSLLVDVHTGASSHEAYTSITTPDPRVGVSISGRYMSARFHKGRWRQDLHSPGTICIHRTDELTRHRFPTPQDPDYRLALIYFPVQQLTSALEHLRRAGQRELPTPMFNWIIDRDPAIVHMTHALLHAMARGVSDLYAQSAASWLAIHLLTAHGPYAAMEDSRRAGTLSDARLNRVIEYMSTHFSQPLSLEQLAAEACISKYHFTRLFRRRVGQSPHKFLAEIRLEAASRLLLNTNRSIADVGAACGYPSAPHFSVAFAIRYGVSPTQYRAQR